MAFRSDHPWCFYLFHLSLFRTNVNVVHHIGSMYLLSNRCLRMVITLDAFLSLGKIKMSLYLSTWQQSHSTLNLRLIFMAHFTVKGPRVPLGFSILLERRITIFSLLICKDMLYRDDKMHLKFWKALINSVSRWKCIANVTIYWTDNAFSMVCPINGNVSTKL